MVLSVQMIMSHTSTDVSGSSNITKIKGKKQYLSTI